ncbi:MAG: hypothetical protein VKM17_01585, partial [Cyanobacteriota bacterium]|nr:hypothetical protein [Cyanobacteriota bacterium]
GQGDHGPRSGQLAASEKHGFGGTVSLPWLARDFFDSAPPNRARAPWGAQWRSVAGSPLSVPHAVIRL